MKVIVTVHMKDIMYTKVAQVGTTRDTVVITLKDNYTVSDESFVKEHNISVVPFIHQFNDCSGIFVAED